jgi:predicted transcriptional regulator
LTDRTKEFVAEIVASYVGANTIAASDLPDLIKIVHRSLMGADPSAAAQEAAAPAADVTTKAKPGRRKRTPSS